MNIRDRAYVRTLLLSSPPILGLMASPGLAQPTVVGETLSIEEVVVTASRRTQSIRDVQASVEVIPEAKLQTFSGATITDALRQSVGLEARNGGANSSVTIRGQIPSGGTSVLILFDGLPRTGKYGITNLNNYPYEDVARIEVIRGPMSALYGANASGGVINIITKPAGGEPRQAVNLTAGTTTAGGRESLNLGATARFGDETLGSRLAFNARLANGFRFNKAVSTEDLSGINELSLTYTADWKGGEGQTLRGTVEGFRQDDKRNAILAAAPPTRPQAIAYKAAEKEDRLYGAVQYSSEIGIGTLALDASYGHSKGSTNRSFPAAIETTIFDQSILQGRYFIEAGDHSLIAGAGWQRDKVDVSINSRSATRDNLNAYIQDELSFADNWKLTGGVRVDDFDDFGTVTNPRVTLGWTGDRLYARGGFGTAFRAPAVLEQYSSFVRGRFLITGNQNLLSEDADTYEAAVGWRGQSASAEVVLHDTKIKNLIEAVQTPRVQNGLIVFEYQNRRRAEIWGVESSFRIRATEDIEFEGSVEYLNAKDADTSVRLTGRSKYVGRVGATWNVDPITMTLRARKQFDFYAADPAIRGSAPFDTDYGVVDANVSYQIADNIKMALGLDNVLGQKVPINWSGTGQIEDPPGRFVYLSLRFAR